MTSVVNTLIIALLGTGGATFIWAFVRSVLAWRRSAEGREDRAVARLEKFEEDCRSQLHRERQWGSYWQRRAAVLEYALILGGLPVPKAEDPPSQE